MTPASAGQFAPVSAPVMVLRQANGWLYAFAMATICWVALFSGIFAIARAVAPH